MCPDRGTSVRLAWCRESANSRLRLTGVSLSFSPHTTKVCWWIRLSCVRTPYSLQALKSLEARAGSGLYSSFFAHSTSFRSVSSQKAQSRKSLLKSPRLNSCKKVEDTGRCAPDPTITNPLISSGDRRARVRAVAPPIEWPITTEGESCIPFIQAPLSRRIHPLSPVRVRKTARVPAGPGRNTYEIAPGSAAGVGNVCDLQKHHG